MAENNTNNGNWRWLLERWGHLEEKINNLMQYPPQIRDRIEGMTEVLYEIRDSLIVSSSQKLQETEEKRRGFYVPWWIVAILIGGAMIGAWQLSIDWDTVDKVTEQAQKVKP